MFKWLLLIFFFWLFFRVVLRVYRLFSNRKAKKPTSPKQVFDRSKIEEAEFVDVEEGKDKHHG
tara:strand:+ start:1888 stop:2076 length:189 start_codon:yes stop_codon:yes gene_type:complete